jgi:predicted small integral membrane protein
MKESKTIALIGAGLLFIGAFMPIVSAPIIGSINYFQNGKGDGVIIVLLAISTAGLALAGRAQQVLWTGLASVAMLAFTFFRFQSGLSEMKERVATDLADNPFRGLADMAVNSVQLQWGWAVLVLGAALVTYAGWTAQRSLQT